MSWTALFVFADTERLISVVEFLVYAEKAMVCDKIWGARDSTTLIDWQLNDKDLSAIFGLDILFPVPPFLEPQILQNNREGGRVTGAFEDRHGLYQVVKN